MTSCIDQYSANFDDSILIRANGIAAPLATADGAFAVGRSGGPT
jgi:hypothetical protein